MANNNTTTSLGLILFVQTVARQCLCSKEEAIVGVPLIGPFVPRADELEWKKNNQKL